MRLLLPKIAIFILGFITGAAVTGVATGYHLDELYMENRLLKNKLVAVEKDLRQLQEQKRKPGRVVTQINTTVSFPEDCDFTEYEKSAVEMAVEKNVGEWLKLVKGQEIDTINYQLVPRIVDNREIEIEGEKIRLKVYLVVISENLVVYLEVRPVNENV